MAVVATQPVRTRSAAPLALRALPIAMCVAPVVTAIASLLIPSGVDEELNTPAKVSVALGAVDASRTRTYLAYLFVVIGLTLLLPAWAGIVALAPNSVLNLTGAVLAAIGIGAGIGTNALTGLNLYVATDPKLATSTGEAFIDRLWQDNAITPLYIVFLLLPIGLLFALVGLIRARAARWWELVVWAAGLVLLLLSSGGWIGALASIVLLAGFLLLGRRLTSRPAAVG